jgi:hypothetical protein
MKKLISLLLTCALLASSLTGCGFIEDLLGTDVPDVTNPPPVVGPEVKENIYSKDDQFLADIDGNKYYMHMKISEITSNGNGNRYLAYLTKDQDGFQRYKPYETFTETSVRDGETSTLYLYNKNSEGVSAEIKVYNTSGKSQPIGECRIYSMTLYRAHLSSQNISFNGFEFASSLGHIGGFLGEYDSSTVSSNGSYYQYHWMQYGGLHYSMTAHVYKNTGKMMSVSYITQDRADKDGNVTISNADKGNNDEGKDDDDYTDNEMQLVFSTTDISVLFCGVENVKGYPYVTFYVANNSSETFQVKLDEIYADGRLITSDMCIVDSVAGNSVAYVSCLIYSPLFHDQIDIKKDKDITLNILLDSTMRQEQKVGYHIDISKIFEETENED